MSMCAMDKNILPGVLVAGQELHDLKYMGKNTHMRK